MAVVTSVSIVNKTLLFLGEDALSTYPDSSTNSNRLAVYYEDAKEQELKKYNWNFAMFREALTKDGTAPINEYTNQFELPTDILRIIGTWPRGIRWKRENTASGERILANTDTLSISYLKNVDEDQMTKEFAIMLAARLAINLAPIFTEREIKFTQAAAWYDDAQKEARRMDSHESSTDQMDNLDVVNVRNQSILDPLHYGLTP